MNLLMWNKTGLVEKFQSIIRLLEIWQINKTEGDKIKYSEL